MTTLNGQSEDILQVNIAALRELFPETCCEGKIDFDKLRQVLGEYVDDDKERYNFTWNGKGKALRFSQTPSMGTLRPCPEEGESKNWDTTQNLYIEGDNLEVLKLLQKSYHGRIKMIYIDPPYNTGNDFVYPDDFSDSLENYKKLTGQVDDEGNKVSTNSEANGRYHTDWLNMMYPRLRLARNLLTDDGVIFISIDDNEQENLKKICREIFGEDNFIACFKWNRVAKAPSLSQTVRTKYEYVLGYYKYTMPRLFGKASYNKQGPLWHLPNKRGEYIFETGSIRVKQSYQKGYYGGSYEVELLDDLIEKGGLNENPVRIAACSAWGQEKINQYILEGKQFEIKTSPVTVYTDLDSENNFIAPSDLISDEECGVKRNTDANDAMKRLEIPFDYSKPTSLIQYLAKMVTYNETNASILDFFSGSATTAHAVMQLNAEDGGNRKFICVQLPEPCAEGTEAAKAGYKNICEIGKERIRRAGEKIKSEVLRVEGQSEVLRVKSGVEGQVEMENNSTLHSPNSKLDVGFKDFKLDTSNLRKWQPDYDDLETSLFDSISNYVDGRTELDVVYEIMLKMGLDLTWPVETHSIGGKNVYTIGMGALMICLDDAITTAVADGMVALYKELAPETWKVVFKDNGFKDDSAKTNIHEILKCAGLDEDAFTTV